VEGILEEGIVVPQRIAAIGPACRAAVGDTAVAVAVAVAAADIVDIADAKTPYGREVVAVGFARLGFAGRLVLGELAVPVGFAVAVGRVAVLVLAPGWEAGAVWVVTVRVQTLRKDEVG
jgi:hypothetical protein